MRTTLRIGDIVATPGNDGWWGTSREVTRMAYFGYEFTVIAGEPKEIGRRSPCDLDRCRDELLSGRWRLLNEYPAHVTLPQGA